LGGLTRPDRDPDVPFGERRRAFPTEGGPATNRLRQFLICSAILALSCGGAGAADDAWLGVFVEDVDGGIELIGIVPGGPADRDGLLRGDILVRADDASLAGLADLGSVLDRAVPGQRLRLELLRAGESVSLDLRLGRRRQAPESPRTERLPARAESVADGSLGWVIVDVTPDLRAHFGAPEDAGVLVTGVRSGEDPAVAGLEVGDVLVALDERPIREVADVERLLRDLARGETGVVASVVRGKQERAITVSLRAAPTAPIAPAPPGESETAEQAIRAEIERLERRIDQLRRRLSRLREAG